MIKKRFKQLMVKRGQCLTVVLFFPEVFLWSYGIKQPSNACYFIFCGSAGTTRNDPAVLRKRCNYSMDGCFGKAGA